MGVLNIKKEMALSSVGEGSVIVHSTNASGVWESECDKFLKTEYPKAFERYSEHCRSNIKRMILGTSCVSECNGVYIVSLICSEGYGRDQDSTYSILSKTIHSVGHAIYNMYHLYGKIPGEIYSLELSREDFRVHWNYTYTPLSRVVIQTPDLVWNVCGGV